ncbi:ubiquitin family protein, partial [Rhizoctonia solani AG-3 Rhs1AP]
MANQNLYQVKISSDKTITCEGGSFLAVEGLKQLIENKADVPALEQRLIFAGKQLSDGYTLGDYNIQKESTIHVFRSLRGGKPLIYLFPPSPTSNIQVQLSLVQSWTFSEIYPPTAISAGTKDTEALGQTIAWSVYAQPDGTWWDHATDREIAYLFWEAYTNPVAFDPANPVLLPSHPVPLPFDKVTGYIDDALLALGLHTEARTSFITYWLPNLSKHTFIALRFLPQNEYEKAAPLNITPAPDVTTRVFMLFRGVEEGQLEQWDEAVAMASKDVTVWRDIIGVDIERVHDKSLFRVLEWGGMEVK